MKETISREVCICKECGMKHSKKLNKTKVILPLKAIKVTNCEYNNSDYCSLIQRHKCEFIESGNFHLCEIRLKELSQ
jgi:ribosomal 30S subunit maturation factor RimM